MGRMVGVGHLVLAVSGFDLFYVFPKLLVRANAAATAANIKAHEGLFLAGFAAALIGAASFVRRRSFGTLTPDRWPTETNLCQDRNDSVGG